MEDTTQLAQALDVLSIGQPLEVTTPPRLDTLPAEILLQVFEGLDDINTLIALACTCHKLNQVAFGDGPDLAHSIIVKHFDPRILKAACLAIHMHIPDHPFRKVRMLVESRRGEDWFQVFSTMAQVPALMELDDIRAIAKLERTIDKLMPKFVASMFKGKPAEFDRPEDLSAAEKLRIRSAFYRLHILAVITSKKTSARSEYNRRGAYPDRGDYFYVKNVPHKDLAQMECIVMWLQRAINSVLPRLSIDEPDAVEQFENTYCAFSVILKGLPVALAVIVAQSSDDLIKALDLQPGGSGHVSHVPFDWGDAFSLGFKSYGHQWCDLHPDGDKGPSTVVQWPIEEHRNMDWTLYKKVSEFKWHLDRWGCYFWDAASVNELRPKLDVDDKYRWVFKYRV